MSSKREKLDALNEELDAMTTSPLYEYRRQNEYHPVPGEGDPDAKIVFIGEAPGKNEAEQGRPFVGASGRILDELLESIELSRQAVYITNVVKDRPPENRDPTAEEIALYAPLLDRQLAIIQPAVIATLGRFAMEFALNRYGTSERAGKISKLHGQILTGSAPYGAVRIVPLYHPAVALYQRSKKATLLADFETLRQAADL